MSGGLKFLVEDLPYGFCPGCSHGQVTDALGEALARLSPDKHKVALVSDIGCVGLVDKHFDLNTFHGLHGRSITYGTGLKLARPELDVFVVIGDGGCGIGGHHLVQAARRGLDLTVIIFNNFNYGMTGGEHSATTPLGAMTSSTPGGNVEQPLDLCALSMAAGATFVARVPAFDRELPAVVARAMEHRGFAVVDVWELCTAYFMPSNAFKKKELLQLSEDSRMPFGVLRDEPPRASVEAPRKPMERCDLTPAPELAATLGRPMGLVLAGSAGQKIKTAGTTLGRAAIRAGLFATQKDDYPITVKTGHSVCELILSPTPVRFTGIESPELAIVLTEDGLRRTRKVLEAMQEGAEILADPSLALPPTRARVTRVDYGAAAKQVGKENVALWALAHALARTAAVPVAALRDATERFTPAKYREPVCRAVDLGAAAGGSGAAETGGAASG